MKGKCNCSKVSFAVNSEVVGLYQCHCKLCQRQSGSTSNTATLVLGFSSHFCKICGSPVPNRLRDTHFYWIPMGSVDVKISTEYQETLVSNTKPVALL